MRFSRLSAFILMLAFASTATAQRPPLLPGPPGPPGKPRTIEGVIASNEIGRAHV